MKAGLHHEHAAPLSGRYYSNTTTRHGTACIQYIARFSWQLSTAAFLQPRPSSRGRSWRRRGLASGAAHTAGVGGWATRASLPLAAPLPCVAVVLGLPARRQHLCNLRTVVCREERMQGGKKPAPAGVGRRGRGKERLPGTVSGTGGPVGRRRVHTAGGQGAVRNSSAPRKRPTPLCPSTHRPDHPQARMAPTSCTSCTVPTACTARTVIQAEGKDLLVVCHVCSVACTHNDARHLQQGQHSRAAGGV